MFIIGLTTMIFSYIVCVCLIEAVIDFVVHLSYGVMQTDLNTNKR